MATRWIVERNDGDLEDYGYESMSIQDGALCFWNGSIFDPKDRCWVAAGHWVTVVEQDDK